MTGFEESKSGVAKQSHRKPVGIYEGILLFDCLIKQAPMRFFA